MEPSGEIPGIHRTLVFCGALPGDLCSQLALGICHEAIIGVFLFSGTSTVLWQVGCLLKP